VTDPQKSKKGDDQIEMPECKTIACVNQKGGVGKSVTSTNLGVGLAKHGKRVLIVDCDCQASQTISLGWKEPDTLPVTLATLLGNQMARKSCDPHDGILHNAEGVDLLPSSIELSGLELRMVNVMNREALLRKLLTPLQAEYDFIVLDCPPTLGMVTINALSAADSVIVPVQPEFLSVVGMTQLFDTVAEIREQINPELRVDGVLITLANMRTTLARNSVDAIRAAYGGAVRIYSTPVPYSVKVKEASTVGQSVFAYEPGGKAAAAYDSLVKEVLRDARQRSIVPTANKNAPEL
jgi:chromosome partitioning protein